MSRRVLHLRQSHSARAFCMGVVAVLVMSMGLQGQTPKKRNIFEDDPTPAPGSTTPGANNGANNPNAARPALAPPVEGFAPGLLSSVHGGITTAAPVTETHIVPHPALNFKAVAMQGPIPMAFSFRGSINVPPGGIRGKFHFNTSGDSDILIDNKPVSAVRRDDPAASVDTEVNLAAGLHPISATVFHMHSDGQSQRLDLTWAATGAAAHLLPRDWCCHARADEPAGVTPVEEHRSETVVGGPAQSDQGWIPANATAVPNPAQKPTDLIAAVVMGQYAGTHLDHLIRWKTQPAFGVSLNAPEPGQARNSLKLKGVLRLRADCRCVFTVTGTTEATVTVDGDVVTRSGFAGEAPIQKIVDLKAGVRVVEMALTAMTFIAGHNPMDLLWSVDNAPPAVIPPDVVAHYRSQEGDGSAVVAGSAQPPAPVVAPAAPSAPIVRTNKLPVPDAGAQAQAAAGLRQRYATSWADPGTAQQAGFLIRAADASRDDAVASYVLLDKAYRQAQSAAAVPLAFQAIDLLASQFTVDAVRLKLTVLQSLGAKRVLDGGTANLIVDLFNQAMFDANYAAACDVATFSLADARQRNLPAEVATANQRLARATAASAEWEQIKPMVARLAENPNDPAANLAVGRFYCFVARNWERGIPALGRSSDAALAWLGRHEASAAQFAMTQLPLANAWWDAADGQTDAVSAAMRERAAQWYMVAEPSLTGLSRRVAGARLRKIAAITQVTSPLVSQAPQGAIANVPATPAQNPVAPPPEPVAGQPQKIHYNPGPFVVVIDRAVISIPRIGILMANLHGESFLTEPTAPVTVIIADTPPVIFNYTAGTFQKDKELHLRIEAAMRAAPAASNLDAALDMAMKTNPARIGLLMDSSISAEHIADFINARDPEKKMGRVLRLFTADRAVGDAKMRDLMRLVGGRTYGGMSTDQPPIPPR